MNISNVARNILRVLMKPLKDFALIFYDDLEFRAMSLPRVAAGVLTAAVGVSWVGAQFCGRPFDGFEALCGLCGGVWAAYTFKRRLMPPGDGAPRGNPERKNYDDAEEENDPDESG